MFTIEAARSLAKDRKTTAEQLQPLIGMGPEAEALVAKHANVTPAQLEKLADSDDTAVQKAVLANSKSPSNVISRLGQAWPGDLLKNPALAAAAASDKGFFDSFAAKSLEDLLKHKDCHVVLGDWVLKHGKPGHQAVFLFGKARPADVLCRFRESPHWQIVMALLNRDDHAYLDWAQNLGFVPPPASAANPDEDEIPLRAQIDFWIDDQMTRSTELWKTLVPKSGEAETVQGELVRAVGRVAHEYHHNGMGNWNDGSSYFGQLIRLVGSTLVAEKSFSPWVKAAIAADVAAIDADGMSANRSSGKRSTNAFGAEALSKLRVDVDGALMRLDATVAVWCDRQPQLIPYTKPA